MRAVHSFFLLEVLANKNRCEGHFASGARRGGNHDFGQTRFRDFVQAQVIHRSAFVGGNHGNGLGHVHRGTAAYADHAVAFIFQAQRRAFIRQFNAGFRFHFVEYGELDAFGYQNTGDFFMQSGFRQIFIDNHQRIFCVMFVKMSGKGQKRSVAENNFFGAGK